MAPDTYAALPTDVKEFLGDDVKLDASIPLGEVRHAMPATDFIRKIRARRKRERQNRRGSILRR